jgi:hypothetical protein
MKNMRLKRIRPAQRESVQYRAGRFHQMCLLFTFLRLLSSLLFCWHQQFSFLDVSYSQQPHTIGLASPRRD